jgi:hydroxymethylbilane synthase
MNSRLEGGCQVPIASYAIHSADGKQLWLRGLVGSPDGKTMLEDDVTGTPEQADALGVTLADRLLAKGAGAILRAVYAEASE